jgi:hypothetical protein
MKAVARREGSAVKTVILAATAGSADWIAESGSRFLTGNLL